MVVLSLSELVILALVNGHGSQATAAYGAVTQIVSDLAPLSGLTKTQVRLLASALGAPTNLVHKQPTADLEELAPGKLDEQAYGCTYEEIDAYLMGEPVSERVRAIVEGAYSKTAHKRALPITP
ncbi:NAD(+) synthase [Pseudomonas sp. MYb541]|uniref:NAD(+) synthase n=1 Tax=Pseudomonas sp. MYb541 TaxID=2745402 RepID=UPI0023D934D3|nr:NAD(+) synthase [Pseudomonas canadensis]MEB2649679.1 NAD(+) synthase [Pseudomonas canadensis]